jgi:hypothetical protein
MLPIMNLAANLFFELPARNKALTTLADDLRTSGTTVQQRIANASDTPRSREFALHLIGIERWGQRRLKVALGEDLIRDEYDGYRPAQDIAFEQLPAEFEQTRQQTLDLVTALENTDYSDKIEHNSFGPLTVRGWLKYLDSHAAMTAKLVR